jgi:hypothetical protein
VTDIEVSASDFESPDALLRRIYDEEFGFLPTNSSMKPVHVANALFRRILGVTTDFRPLGRVIRQYKKKNNKNFLVESNPNAAILVDFGTRFADEYGNQPNEEVMTAFRSLAKETLGADGAAFDTGQSSFTLSHRRMITTDVSDNGSGDLLAALLGAGAELREPKARNLLQTLLEDDTDPWTTIGWPMLDVGEEREAALAGAALVRASRTASLLATDQHGVLLSPTLRELRSRFDQLADFEDTYGAKLTTLRRTVLFGCFCIHVHMIRRCGDVIEDGPRPPILLDLFDGRRRSLREASAATLQAGFRSIEQLVLHRIGEHVDNVCVDGIGAFLDNLPISSDNDVLRAEYQVQCTGSEPRDALAEAYWKMGYSSVGPRRVGGDGAEGDGTRRAQGLPWHALLALGRRSGYLLPYDDRGRGGKEHKRYGANAEFAEVLVAATVEPGDPIDLDEFLDRLRDSFGIVIGRRVDFDVIRRNDLRLGAELQRSVSVNENDLRANLLAFKELMIEIGFAKSYADGRTVITTDVGRIR